MYDLSKAKEYAKQNIKARMKNGPGAGRRGRLSGKIAVVTGSAQGFGLGIAREMYEEGACVR